MERTERACLVRLYMVALRWALKGAKASTKLRLLGDGSSRAWAEAGHVTKTRLLLRLSKGLLLERLLGLRLESRLLWHLLRHLLLVEALVLHLLKPAKGILMLLHWHLLY